MNKFITVILFALGIFAAPAYGISDILPEGKTWELQWNDEFGNELDRTKWNYVTERKRRDGYWDDAAISVKRGKLKLKAWKLPAGQIHVDGTVFIEDRYFSGGITTEGLHNFGGNGETIYVTCRLKLNGSWGHWPSCWLMPDSIYEFPEEWGTGRDWSELDMVEGFPYDIGERVVNSAVHFDRYGEEHQKLGFKHVVPNPQGFNTYGLMWTPDKYYFYVDGKLVWETDFGGVCQRPLGLRITDEIGGVGGWNDKGTMHYIDDALLPDESVVDYIRVYKAK